MGTSAVAGQQLADTGQAVHAVSRRLGSRGLSYTYDELQLVVDALSDAGYQLVDSTRPGLVLVNPLTSSTVCDLPAKTGTCTRRARWQVTGRNACSLHLVRAARAARLPHAPATPLGRNTSA